MSSGVLVLQEVVAGVELVLCLAVAVVLGRRWRRRRSRTTASALGIFVLVALVLAAARVIPEDTGSGWAAVASDTLICVLLAIPYLLVRFTWSLGGLGDRTHRLLGALLVVEWVATLAAPPLPAEGAPHPPWMTGYLVLVLGAWAVQCTAAAAGLWRAGRGQASVVRHRMRALSTGGLLLALTLVLSGAVSGDAPDVLAVSISLLGLLSIALFAIAFLPPAPLRLVWRQADVAALATAERGLMTALTREDVAATIVPVIGRVFGGGGAALLDADGRPVRTAGLSAEQVVEMTAHVLGGERARQPAAGEAGVLVARLTGGWLVVQGGLLSPVFGDDEVVLLERVGTLVDLALQRAELFEQEQVSRRVAEAAGAELETLLYSVSHDLRSPLISVLGYLDVLQQEHVAELTGEGPHYLARISVNALYMQSLIADLLELSRIGRSEVPPVRLDLQELAEQVLEGARMSHPGAELVVEGELPPLSMSDVRARQLLTNLVDNALKHGGRDDLRIAISARPTEEGGLLLQVADDGRGVPPEYRERVLRVFERLDAARSSAGTGMGLAICKRIVENVGGRLSVEGPPVSAPTGTTVVVELPPAAVVDDPADPAVPAPRSSALSSAESRTAIEESA